MANKHMVIQAKYSDEIYNCIEETTGSVPQHHNLGNNNKSNDRTSSERRPSDDSETKPHVNGNDNTTNGYERNRVHGFEITQNNSSYNDDDYENQFGDEEVSRRQGPSNENLLGTAFCTFMGFALIQTVVATFAKSEAMLGDSAAMIVDALTYLFNWFAERKKATYETREWVDSCPMESVYDDDTKQRILARTKRKKVLHMELIPPLMSVSTLIVVTAVVLRQSIRVLILDVHRSKAQQGNPNIHIMMYFSIANLGLDLINVANFAKAKHLFGYETNDQPAVPQGHEALSTDGDIEGDNEGSNKTHSPTKGPPSHEDSLDDGDEDQDHTANLNMCSAYTHVFADTLRSIAVLVAACLSELIEDITPEEADASAAVVVSGLILLSLIPLSKGLVQTSNELRLIRAEEKSDELFLTSFSSRKGALDSPKAC